MTTIRYALGVTFAVGVLSGRASAADWPGPPPVQIETPPTAPFPIPPDDTNPPVVTPPTDNPTTGTGQPPAPSDDNPTGPPKVQDSPEPATLGLALVGIGSLFIRRKRA